MNKPLCAVSRVILIVVVCGLVFGGCTPAKKEVPITTLSDEARQLFLQGRDKQENVELTAAASLFDQAIAKDSTFALAYCYRAVTGGGTNVFRNNVEKAIHFSGHVSEGEKLMVDYMKAYMDGQQAKQKEAVDKMLTMYPEDKRVHLWAGAFDMSQGNFGKAIEAYGKSIELDTTFAAAYNLLGYAYISKGDLAAAEKPLRQYIALNSNSPNPYDSYAELLMKMGRYTESIQQYQQAYDKDHQFVGSLAGIGNNYVFLGDFVKAREYYQRYFAEATRPSDRLSAIMHKSMSYVHEGVIDNALNAMEEYRTISAQENRQTNVILSYAYEGFILTEAGKAAAGMKKIEQAVDAINTSTLPPATKEYYSLLGDGWTLYGLTANNMIEKATTVEDRCLKKVEARGNKNEQDFLNFMSALLDLKQKSYDKALAHLDKVIEDPMTLYYQAKAYAGKGEMEKAKKIGQRVINWNQNSLQLAIVRQRAMKEFPL